MIGNVLISELTASHLPDVYKLWEFHAHWGTEKNCGSEHLINGKGFSAEVCDHFDMINFRNFFPILK